MSKSLITKVVLALSGSLTKEWCIASWLFWKACLKMYRKSGALFLVLYIKQARVCLQKCAVQDKTLGLSMHVSLTRSGIPRIIPSFHRARIKRGDEKIIQLYLSLMSLTGLIPLAKAPSKKTLESIVTPAPLESIEIFVSELRPHIRNLVERYVPSLKTIPLHQGLEFRPSWKSVPNLAWFKRLVGSERSLPHGVVRSLQRKASAFNCLPYELAAFQAMTVFVHARGEQFSPGCLWPPYVRYAFDSFNRDITNNSLTWFESRIGPFLPSPSDLGVPAAMGRLCAACTGNAKLRVFSIGNYIKQRLLHPWGNWFNEVLRRIPMDGTFDQVKPLDLLHGVKGCAYSVDLKSATDRWPLLVMFELAQALFDRSTASAVVNSALGTNVFDVAFTKKRAVVAFVPGQPLGLYASWPLFALSHHLIIWWAAEHVYPGGYFDKYALLGDDVLIVDDRVCQQYRLILERLGVGVSEGKCLTSPSGGCEFAKKMRLRAMTVDASPLSLKKLLDLSSLIGFYNFDY